MNFFLELTHDFHLRRRSQSSNPRLIQHHRQHVEPTRDVAAAAEEHAAGAAARLKVSRETQDPT